MGSAITATGLPKSFGDYHATIEATEAAIVNALLAAGTATGRHGVAAHGLEPDRLLEAMRRVRAR